MAVMIVAAGLVFSAVATAQVSRTKASLKSDAATPQQPLYTNYKGVTLGMTTEEARAKLGTPAMKAVDQDFYVFSDNETAQIVYDATHKVVTISVDYVGGVGAPDYKTVVSGELVPTPSGSLYKIVRYESLHFWVSYNRTVGPVPTVTVTLQKI
jgi:hypothetical protein